MSSMSSNYPPGVSGNEPQIAGDPDLEALLDQPTAVLLERLDHTDDDSLREAIRAELADRAIGRGVC